MWRTVAIATCGMALALVLAVPLTLAVLLRRCGAQDGRFSRSSRRSARSARPARPSPSIGKELLSPASDPAFIWRVTLASLETLAMSAVGTLLAAIAGLALALPASRTHAGDRALLLGPMRLALNALRSIPELAWAALLLIAAGLGPFAGTLALAFHTTGVLGRLFAEAIENAPAGPAAALRVQGVPASRVL